VGVIRAVVSGWVVAVVASTFGAAGHAESRLDPCPPPWSLSPIDDASAVVAGAFRAIQRIYPDMNFGQGRTDPVTRRTTLVREVIELNRTSADALRFRRLASRRCGSATALRSWAVVAQFPLAPMATTGQLVVVVVDTRDGWKLYAAALDHY
jgi:hypothetical protein